MSTRHDKYNWTTTKTGSSSHHRGLTFLPSSLGARKYPLREARSLNKGPQQERGTSRDVSRDVSITSWRFNWPAETTFDFTINRCNPIYEDLLIKVYEI